MPRLTALSLSPKRCCTVSRNTKRATKKASVAPMLEANDANNKPCHKPNSAPAAKVRSEEHTSELQSRGHLVCRLLLEKKKAERRRRDRSHRERYRLQTHYSHT